MYHCILYHGWSSREVWNEMSSRVLGVQYSGIFCCVLFIWTGLQNMDRGSGSREWCTLHLRSGEQEMPSIWKIEKKLHWPRYIILNIQAAPWHDTTKAWWLYELWIMPLNELYLQSSLQKAEVPICPVPRTVCPHIMKCWLLSAGLGWVILYENILQQHSDIVKVSNFLHSKGSVGIWGPDGLMIKTRNYSSSGLSVERGPRWTELSPLLVSIVAGLGWGISQWVISIIVYNTLILQWDTVWVQSMVAWLPLLYH